MRAKLLSIFWNFINTFKKFPITHIILVFLTIVACFGVKNRDIFTIANEKLYLAWWLAFIFSLFWPLRFEKSESTKKSNTINILSQLCSILIWIVYLFIIRNINFNYISYSSAITYFWILPIAFVALLWIIALKYKDQEKKTVFCYTNIVLSIIFGWIIGLILRWWLSGAIRSIATLLFNNIQDTRHIYWYIWCISMILMATSFGLNYYLIKNSYDHEIQPSRVNRIFWSYIFLPLTLLYLVIFLAYWIKILVTWIWPKWVIVWLWFGYYALGILAIVSTYLESNKTYKTLYKIILWSFILVGFMMIYAIYQRIQQHWVTINRYFVCAGITIIIWTSLLSLLFSKKKFLTFLCVIFIVSIIWVYWWPLSAKQVSLNSQLKELHNLLQNEKLELPLKANSLAWLHSTWINTVARTLEDMSSWYDIKDRESWIIERSGAHSQSSYDLTYWYLWYDYYNDYAKETRLNRDFYENWQNKPAFDISNYTSIYPIWWWYYNAEYPYEDNKFQIQVWKDLTTLDLSSYWDMFYDAIKEMKEWSQKYPFILVIWDKTYALTHIELVKSEILNYIRITEIWWYVLIK